MMSTTFDEMRLQPGFTFRIVEAIKQTKIQAPPSKMTLPFSVSVAAGLIVLLLSMSIPYSPLYPIGQLIGSVLPSQARVTENGVIPIGTIKIASIVSLSPETNNGNFGQKPKPEVPKMECKPETWTINRLRVRDGRRHLDTIHFEQITFMERELPGGVCYASIRTTTYPVYNSRWNRKSAT